jgi:uncharacterized protein
MLLFVETFWNNLSTRILHRFIVYALPYCFLLALFIYSYINRIGHWMDSKVVTFIKFLQRQAASLLLYQSVLENDVGQAFLELLQSLRYADVDAKNSLQAYGNYFRSLALTNQNWEDFLICQILKSDNPFSHNAQSQNLKNLPSALVTAAKHDLEALQSLYDCSTAILSEWVQASAHLSISPVVWYKESLDDNRNLNKQTVFINALQQIENWGEAIEDLANYYRKFGVGLFAEYQALRWQNGNFVGIPYPDTICLQDLTGYETQKEALLKNTEFLLSGHSALHVILYGSRGSGKSSLVKALLNEYSDRHLRIVEVGKADLKDLPKILEYLRNAPQKFIIFVDDLSFEEDDDAFKSLKVVLEGNLTARSKNVVVYATSNRRHLVREFFADRPRPKDSDEVHAWDTMQEKISFSDRFGLTLTFEPADQQTYLTIVNHLATQGGLNLKPEDLEYKALQWATVHNGRSGRTARQFIDYLTAEVAMNRN